MIQAIRCATLFAMIMFFWCAVPLSSYAVESTARSIPKEHPRLLGPRNRLQKLAADRADAYQRVVSIAREAKADDHAKMVSMSLVCAIEEDEQLGKSAVQMAMKYITGPIRRGHVTFGSDLARCAIVYDLFMNTGLRNSAPSSTNT